MKRNVLPGLLLILVGVFALTAQYVEVPEGGVLIALGVLFLVAYTATRVYGYLIPGAILAAVGVGEWIHEVNGRDIANGGMPLVALAVAFASIYLIDALTTTTARWWPLVPGTILGFIGVSLWLERTDFIEQAARWWPLALIAIGVFVLARLPRGRIVP